MTEELAAVECIIARLEPLDDHTSGVVVCGKITRITVESNLLRQMGGNYTGDTIAASIDYKPEYLPCDFVINDPDQKITKAGSSIILVKEVAQQLSKELDVVVAVTMAAHGQAVEEVLNPPKETPAETMLVRTTEVF